MDTIPTALIPHVLRLVQPGDAEALFLSTSETQNHIEEWAVVFPSFQLACRYADHFIHKGGPTYSPVAAPARAPNVATAGTRCRGCGCTATFACPDGCFWVEPDLCSACRRGDPPDMWAVYRSPSDYPGKSVARRFCGQVPTTDILVADDDQALSVLRPAELTVVPRMRGDDPAIVETWA